MDKLKPCPFCGGELSTIDIRKDRQGLYHANAFCLNLIECGISIDTVHISKEKAIETLINHWNRRTE